MNDYHKWKEDPFEKQVGGDHYKNYAIEPFKFLAANNTPHAEGEVIYRVLRHREKNGAEDIDKAIHTLEMIKAYYYGDS